MVDNKTIVPQQQHIKKSSALASGTQLILQYYSSNSKVEIWKKKKKKLVINLIKGICIYDRLFTDFSDLDVEKKAYI